MDKMDFVQGVVRTRVLEKKLLSRARLERMIEAKDIQEVFKALNETEYANAVSEVSRGEDYEKILSSELKRVYNLMREITADQRVVDILALKYDYHNLKVLFKERELKSDLSHLYVPIGISDFSQVKTAFLEGDLREIEPEFKEAIEGVEKDYEATQDPQRIDLLFDRYYYEHLYRMAEDTGIELFINYVKDMIDFTNIRSSIRLKKQGKDPIFFEDVIIPNGHLERERILFTLNDSVENIIQKFKNERISKELLMGLESYRETNRLSDFEKHMDNYLMGLNRPSKYIVFGPEPIFSYIVAKEAEIKTLRIIMVSKLNKISPDATRERVRELYV